MVITLIVFKKESEKLISSSSELERRRLNWRMFTQEKVEKKFNEVIHEAFKANYPFNLFCIINNDTVNEATVQLSSGTNKTGVIEKIDTPTSKGFKSEAEKGSALVASFSITGNVAFIIYPYKSNRYSRNEDYIILYAGISPDDVTDKVIDKCISNYFFYIRNSSIYGIYASSSLLSAIKLNWMLFVDIRNRRKIIRSFYSFILESFKIFATIVITAIVTYVVTSN